MRAFSGPRRIIFVPMTNGGGIGEGVKMRHQALHYRQAVSARIWKPREAEFARRILF